MSDAYIPYFRPTIEEEEIDGVVRVLRNGWLTTGPRTRAFEDAFAAASGVKHAIALNSCTAALHLALAGLEVGPGDEVVMPSLTFVAGAQCARHLGATPVFCDVNSETLSADAQTINDVLTKRTRAIILMHYAGRPSDVNDITRLAENRGIHLIEDAAHAVGTLINGKWPGTTSSAAAYSFYATKNITCAEGGMLVTNTDKLAKKVRTLALHGMDHDAWNRYTQSGKWAYDVIATGYKYNMSDVAAAMASEQLPKLERLQRQRADIAQRYLNVLRGSGVIRPGSYPVQPPSRHSWCMFPIVIEANESGLDRDAVIAEFAKRGIGTSVHYVPTHLFSAYRDAVCADLPVTEAIWKKLVSIPLYPSMTDGEVQRVTEALSEMTALRRRRTPAKSL